MTIKEIFDTMDYGPAPESASEALKWLADPGGIAGHYINGKWGPLRDDFPSNNPATGEKLAGVTKGTAEDVDATIAAARKAQPSWAKSGHKRARVLYAIARLMQKHARLLAVMETLDNGKPIRESRDIDVPLAIRHFYHHAGFAQLMKAELPDREALGVCGQIIPWNFPLLMLAWKIAPALAMGNTVVLKPAEYTSLTALLFADICRQAGLPKGVVNIVTGDGAVGEMIVDADVEKVAPLLPLIQCPQFGAQQLVDCVGRNVRRAYEPGVRDFERHLFHAGLGEMLTGVDLDLELQFERWCILGLDAIDQVDPSLLEDTTRLPEPRIQNGTCPVEGPADRLGADLNQVDVLRVASRRGEIDLVQGGAAAKGQAVRQLGNCKKIDDGAANDEVLLDLSIEQPWCLCSPRGDVIFGNHSSGSTSTLTMSFQPGIRCPPAMLAARRSGA